MRGQAKAPKRQAKPRVWAWVKAEGDGWVYPRRRVPNYRHFSETWEEAKNKGMLVNIVRKRKSKKRHPDMDPIPLPGYLPK